MTILPNEEKSSQLVLERQHKLIQSNEMIVQILGGMNIYVILLNKNREIVYINSRFCQALNISNNEVLGIRPGDLLNCKYAGESFNGCGHSKECAFCLAKNLIVESIQSGRSTEGQVSFLSIIKGLEITSTFGEKVSNIQVGKERLYMVAFIDKSLEVEKDNLEHIFFHDILNSASSLYNIIRFLKMGNTKFEDDEEIEMIEGYIQNIIDEIEYHRSISSAERNNLNISFETVDIDELLGQVVKMLNRDERFHLIKVDRQVSRNTSIIKTDRLILKRIFINLLKNAFEANENHSIVRISTEMFQDHVHIIFHNEETIPFDYQREIFAKGYSSKSKGRGFGIYGSKLLLTKYLNGNLNFTSNKEMGTDFIVVLPKEEEE